MNTINEITNKLRSHDNKIALGAIESLRARGWLEDGHINAKTFCKAQFQGADLFKANLRGCDFHQTQLEWADLSNADLTRAKLTRTNLSNTNFTSTNLNNADLYKANLRGARNLTEEQLMNVTRLSGAIMPDGKQYDGRFNLPGDLQLAEWNNIDTNSPKEMADFYGVALEAYLHGRVKVEINPA